MDTHSSDFFEDREPGPGGPDPSNSESANSVALFARFVDGNAFAADALFHRYADRLITLTRARLSKKLAGRVGPDDIVMSAYRSFFVKARDGKFEVTQPGAVWRLLVQITLHKLYRQAAHHRSRRRTVDRETQGGHDEVQRLLSREPSPDAVGELADVMQRWLDALSADQRQVIEMRMQGDDIADIAAALSRSEKTVRRHLAAAERLLVALQSQSEKTGRPLKRYNLERPKTIRRKGTKHLIPGVTNLRYEDYVLQRQIGSGATGKVYQATHREVGETLAIKFLKKQFLNEPAILLRFLAEARILAGLQHQGIIRLHGIGRTPGGGYFIATDLAASGDLDQFARRNATNLRTLVGWLCEAADALEFAHQHGVVHCDIKPSNLLISAEQKLIVTDFGFARQLTVDANSAKFIAGTPAFMAPEQIDPSVGSISTATDIYGLGAVLYLLLFGHPPRSGTSVSNLLDSDQSHSAIPFPITESANFPTELLAVCQDCLIGNASKRIPSMAELAARLRSTRWP